MGLSYRRSWHGKNRNSTKGQLVRLQFRVLLWLIWKTDESNNKSPVCFRTNPHSKACLKTMAKCTLTSYHNCVYSTILDIGVYYLPPLRYIHRFNDPWCLIHKSDGSSDMLQHFYISNLLPRHWHVLQEFHNCMRHILQCTAIKYNAHKQNVKMK